MKRLLMAAASCLWLTAGAAAQTTAPLAGEVRAFAVDVANQTSLLELHRAGWLEAAGQLLAVDDFPAAFKMIGRAWTAEKSPSDRFAVPNLRTLAKSAGDIDA